MEWNRTDAFGWDEYNFYDDGDRWIARYIPKKDKIDIEVSVTKEELAFIYNTIKHR